MRAVTVHDTKAVELRDLAAQFYLTEEDVGKNRADACKDKLQELNTSVAVSSSSAELTEDFLKRFQVGCCVDLARIRSNARCVEHSTPTSRCVGGRSHVGQPGGSQEVGAGGMVSEGTRYAFEGHRPMQRYCWRQAMCMCTHEGAACHTSNVHTPCMLCLMQD